MVRGIDPSVEGTRKGLLQVSIAHTSGGALGGAASFALVWLLLTPIRTLSPDLVVFAAVTIVLVWAALRDVGLSSSAKGGRQVAQGWMTRFRPRTAYFFYGVELGTGFMTFAPYGVFFVLIVTSGLILDFGQLTLVGAIFGIARTVLVGPIAVAIRRRNYDLNALLTRAYKVLPLLSLACSVLMVAGIVLF